MKEGRKEGRKEGGRSQAAGGAHIPRIRYFPISGREGLDLEAGGEKKKRRAGDHSAARRCSCPPHGFEFPASVPLQDWEGWGFNRLLFFPKNLPENHHHPASDTLNSNKGKVHSKQGMRFRYTHGPLSAALHSRHFTHEKWSHSCDLRSSSDSAARLTWNGVCGVGVVGRVDLCRVGEVVDLKAGVCLSAG